MSDSINNFVKPFTQLNIGSLPEVYNDILSAAQTLIITHPDATADLQRIVEGLTPYSQADIDNYTNNPDNRSNTANQINQAKEALVPAFEQVANTRTELKTDVRIVTGVFVDYTDAATRLYGNLASSVTPSPTPTPATQNITPTPTPPVLPTTPPAPVVAANNENVLRDFIAVIASKTGYDVAEIDPTYELEADLGVDTVKQAEIFAVIREKLNLPRDDNFRFSDYKTVQSLAGYLSERVAQTAPAVASPTPPTPPTPSVATASMARIELRGAVPSVINPNHELPKIGSETQTPDGEQTTTIVTFREDSTGIPKKVHCGENVATSMRVARENVENVDSLVSDHDFKRGDFAGGPATVTFRKTKTGFMVTTTHPSLIDAQLNPRGEVLVSRFSSQGHLTPVVPDLSDLGEEVLSFKGPSSNVADGDNHPNGVGIVHNLYTQHGDLIDDLHFTGVSAHVREAAIPVSMDALGWHAGLMASGEVCGTVIKNLTIHDAQAFKNAPRLLVHTRLNREILTRPSGRADVPDFRYASHRVTVLTPDNKPVASADVLAYLDPNPNAEGSATNRLIRQVRADMSNPSYRATSERLLTVYERAVGNKSNLITRARESLSGAVLGSGLAVFQPNLENLSFSQVVEFLTSHRTAIGHTFEKGGCSALAMGLLTYVEGKEIKLTDIAFSMGIMFATGAIASAAVSSLGLVGVAGYLANSVLNIGMMQALNGNLSLNPSEWGSSLASMIGGGGVESFVAKSLAGLAGKSLLGRMIIGTATSFSGLWAGAEIQRKTAPWLGAPQPYQIIHQSNTQMG